MGSEFLKDLATYFAQTHGTVLKTAYVEMLTGLIHPIANTATAEVNHPEWAQAISVIRAQAAKMASKDKYWQTGYPLVVTCLCVSPREVFMEQWQACLAQGISKLKVCSIAPSLLHSPGPDPLPHIIHRTSTPVQSSPTRSCDCCGCISTGARARATRL